MVAAVSAPFRSGRRGMVVVLSAVCVLFAAQETCGQSDLRAQLFREAGEARARAKELNADLLAPRSFERGTDAYTSAENLFSRHKPLDDIKEQIRLATQYFSLAIEESKTAQLAFGAALKARSNAISSDAMRLSPALWNEAEDILLSAAASLEDGDTPSARTDAGEAQGIYRSAELEAIKLSLLTPARELLARAEQLNVKATARKTLERAYQRLDIAESMIRQNRYDITEARRLAGEARYEAAHAIYLHEIISQMQEHKATFEDAMLLSEAAIGRIASGLNIPVRFDGGYEPVVQQIIAAVQSRDSARSLLAQRLRRLTAENGVLHRSPASTGPAAGTAPGPRPGAEGRAGNRQVYNSAVALAGTFFTPAEGSVLRDGERVVLRIYGLTFSRENNGLEPGCVELLSKIDHAIRLFPSCRLTVEGHTEAAQSETLNQKNSEAWAAAVTAYLRSFPPALPIIESQGWGSSCPIADNATAEGRARNRRIDIIIIPEWTIDHL